MPTTTPIETVPEVEVDPDFELDISIVEEGPVIAELMLSTSDNCGSTCGSACTSCKS